MNDVKWTQAVVEEMKTLQKKDTWILVPLPNEKKFVKCKWVFSIKHKAYSSIERYRTRLAARGYTQTYGIDYQETFSPIAKLNTIRVFLSLTANLDWPIHQFDVKMHFYMEILRKRFIRIFHLALLSYHKLRLYVSYKKHYMG